MKEYPWNEGYAKYYFWQPAKAKWCPVHFLLNITIRQVNLNYMCVFSYSHIKNALVTSTYLRHTCEFLIATVKPQL